MDQSIIEMAVIAVTGVTLNRMKKKVRNRELVWARQLVYFFCRENRVRKSQTEIGSRYGQNHATVYHGQQRIENLLFADREMQRLVRDIRQLIPKLWVNWQMVLTEIGQAETDKELMEYCCNTAQL